MYYTLGRCHAAGAAREQISIVGMGGREHAREKTPGTLSGSPNQ